MFLLFYSHYCRRLLILTVLRSDNANGLFGFEGLCQPVQLSVEGTSYSCVVRRERGDAGK